MIVLKSTLFGLALLAAVGCGKDDDDEGSDGNFTLKGSGDATAALNVATGLDPDKMMVKVYGFAVSKNANCSDMTSVLEVADPEYTDFLAGPTLAQDDLGDGSYPCVAFRIGDVLKVTPSESDGESCEAGSEYEVEVCRDGSGGQHHDGTEFTCTEGVEESVTFYVSTLSQASGGQDYPEECEDPDGGEISDCNGMLPPTEDLTWRGFKLATALQVSGETTGYMIIDGKGKVGSENTGPQGSARCGMEPPSFSAK